MIAMFLAKFIYLFIYMTMVGSIAIANTVKKREKNGEKIPENIILKRNRRGKELIQKHLRD